MAKPRHSVRVTMTLPVHFRSVIVAISWARVRKTYFWASGGRDNKGPSEPIYNVKPMLEWRSQWQSFDLRLTVLLGYYWHSFHPCIILYYTCWPAPHSNTKTKPHQMILLNARNIIQSMHEIVYSKGLSIRQQHHYSRKADQAEKNMKWEVT